MTPESKKKLVYLDACDLILKAQQRILDFARERNEAGDVQEYSEAMFFFEKLSQVLDPQIGKSIYRIATNKQDPPKG
jgi:hypothetical protein